MFFCCCFFFKSEIMNRMFYVTPCAVSPTCTVALVIPRLRTNDFYYSLLADAERPAAIRYNHSSQYFLESSLFCSVAFCLPLLLPADAERRPCGQTAASCSLVNLHRSQLRDNATHPVLVFEANVQKVAWNWLFFLLLLLLRKFYFLLICCMLMMV